MTGKNIKHVISVETKKEMSSLNEIKEESHQLISQTITLISSIRENHESALPIHLQVLMPKLDNNIAKFKHFFPDKPTEKTDNGNKGIAQARIKQYLKTRKKNLDAMFEKTFAFYDQALTDLNKKVVKISSSFQTMTQNNETEVEAQLEELNRIFQIEYQEMLTSGQEAIDAYREKVEKSLASLTTRLDEEDQSVTEHYEQIYQSKVDSLKMTEAAYLQAKTNSDESTLSTKKEVEIVIANNNDILKKHNDSVMSTLVETEQQVKDLQRKVDEVNAKYKILVPEYENKWKQRQAELLAQFEQSDKEYQRNKESSLQQLAEVEQQMKEYNSIIKESQDQNINAIEQASIDLEAKLTNILEQRQHLIDEPSQKLKKQYKTKVNKLKENLKNIEAQAKAEEDAVLSRIQDKAQSHQEKMKQLKEEHEEFVKNITKEREEIKNNTIQLRIDWKKEKEKVSHDYKQEIIEVQQSCDKEDKYFQTKHAALTEELNRVREENKQLLSTISENEKEINEQKDKNLKDEEELTVTLAEQMKAEADERVKNRMTELRSKHQAERNKLMEEMKTAKQNEVQLQEKYQDAIQASQEDQNRIVSINASKDLIQAKTNDWRKNFFISCKSLKDEEAKALKILEKAKLEFKESLERTFELREKLKKISDFYNSQIDTAQGKTEEELKELLQVLLSKEKEVNELERQINENQKELLRKTRQVEQAEDKINNLRRQLEQEKEKIKEQIQKDFKPLFENEKQKKDEWIEQIDNLRLELEYQVEYTQQCISLVDASNAAMQDGLRKESEQMVVRLKEQLLPELRKTESDVSDQLSIEEENIQQKCSDEVNSFSGIEKEADEKYEKKLNKLKAQHQKEVGILNDECMAILSSNYQKKEKYNQLNRLECEMCPRLKRSIKQLENQMIEYQEKARDLKLDDQNKKESYQKFHSYTLKSPPLPPLSNE